MATAPASRKRSRHTFSQQVDEDATALGRIRRMPPAGFPSSKKVHLRYCCSITLDPDTTGALSYTGIVANGMYDPQTAVGGHQPMGFDQWMTVYNHYTVTESVISMRWVPIAASSVVPGIFGIYLDDDNTIPVDYAGDYTSMVESGRARYATYGLTDGIGRGKDPHVRKVFNARKFFGAKFIVGEDSYKGSSVANPTENAVFHVWAASPGSGADPPSQRFEIVVDYVAILGEPRALPVS